MTIIKIVLSIFLCILFVIDCTIPILKAFFAKQGLNAMGSYFGNVLLILTRVCVAIYLPTSAYLIQEGIGYKSISVLYSSSLFVTSIIAIYLSLHLKKSFNAINRLIKKLKNIKSISTKIKGLSYIDKNNQEEPNKKYKNIRLKYIIYFIIV